MASCPGGQVIWIVALLVHCMEIIADDHFIELGECPGMPKPRCGSRRASEPCERLPEQQCTPIKDHMDISLDEECNFRGTATGTTVSFSVLPPLEGVASACRCTISTSGTYGFITPADGTHCIRLPGPSNCLDNDPLWAFPVDVIIFPRDCTTLGPIDGIDVSVADWEECPHRVRVECTRERNPIGLPPPRGDEESTMSITTGPVTTSGESDTTIGAPRGQSGLSKSVSIGVGLGVALLVLLIVVIVLSVIICQKRGKKRNGDPESQTVERSNTYEKVVRRTTGEDPNIGTTETPINREEMRYQELGQINHSFPGQNSLRGNSTYTEIADYIDFDRENVHQPKGNDNTGSAGNENIGKTGDPKIDIDDKRDYMEINESSDDESEKKSPDVKSNIAGGELKFSGTDIHTDLVDNNNYIPIDEASDKGRDIDTQLVDNQDYVPVPEIDSKEAHGDTELVDNKDYIPVFETPPKDEGNDTELTDNKDYIPVAEADSKGLNVDTELVDNDDYIPLAETSSKGADVDTELVDNEEYVPITEELNEKE